MKTFSLYSNYVFILYVFVALLFSCNDTAKHETTETNAAKDSSDYKLIWSDEFNGSLVDTSNWVYDLGNNGWGNHEQEYYQAANATVENGNLIITGKKEDIKSAHYTSTRMKTKGKHEFLYGKIEARIKMSVARGFWPAFWMLGANIDAVDWPACGEVDIMEHINADSLLFGTLHWNNNGHVQNGDTLTFTPSSFHIYAVEWDSASMRWYLDGKQYHTVAISDSADNSDEFHKPQFILLNFALGGDWPGQQIDDSKLPAKMYVDYVRVYKKNQ